MATYRERNGRVQVQIRLEGLPAKSKSFKTREAAVAWAEANENAMRQAQTVYKKEDWELTLKDLIERYRDTIAIRQRGYKNFQGPLLTAFAREAMCEKRLTELRFQDFTAYRDKRLNVVKPSTLKGELATIQRAFYIANKEWEISIPNYVAQLEFKAKSKERSRRISSEEHQIIRAAIMSRATATRRLVGDILDFALETGMRQGEILKVRPRHYDCKASTLNIPITKTDEPRTIALTETACKIIEKRLHSDPCFPIKQCTLRKAWETAVKQTGIEDIRFHDTRHEAISTFFDLGLSTPEVANQSGHKDYKTLARYSHARIQTIVEKLRLAS